MNKKKLITTLGALSLAATITIGGTVAYLTDQDAADNKFTGGIWGEMKVIIYFGILKTHLRTSLIRRNIF